MVSAGLAALGRKNASVFVRLKASVQALLCELRIVGSTRSCVRFRNPEARTEPVRRNVAHLGRACLSVAALL